LEKLISVILPVYNSEKYISEAIESIINQTYTNFELLVLDDGSTDTTLDIVQCFNDKRIKIFTSEENHGIVHQLNKGIENSQGEYIARMDADDISLPERFEKQIEFLENVDNSKIDLLGTDALEIGENVKPIIHQNYLPSQISFLLNFTCPILHPTVIFRKRLFDKGFRYPYFYEYAEDYAFWRIIDNGDNLAILPQILLQYRIHNTQTNKDEKRYKIQKESALRVSLMKPFNLIDRLFLTKNLKLKYFSLKNNNYCNVHNRIYIRLRKKYLGIKYHGLNKFISTKK
jgi:glycosyltransferase involved in cell wall biosynthesis